MKGYWLHRISHEWEVSYPLLERGYLAIGWRSLSGCEVLQAVADGTYADYCKEKGVTERSRWNLWYFAQFQTGDIVVVPRFDGLFEIVEIIEPAAPISELGIERFYDENQLQITKSATGLFRGNSEVDIGFFCKVNRITGPIPRADYADHYLTARMKMRQANGDIADIEKNINRALTAASNKKPITLYAESKDKLAEQLLTEIKGILNPDKVEDLVALYFEKIGATTVYKPPKNEANKEDGADADVIACFEHLKTVYYVQVKDHDGTTSDWAVKQIEEYTKQKNPFGEDYTSIPWVISTSEDFSLEAKQKARDAAAENRYIRLITGPEFASMLIEAGLGWLDALGSSKS